MPMLFKSCCMVSLSSSFVVFQAFSLSCLCTACLGSLLSSIRRTCRSHLSLLSFMIRPIFSSCVYALPSRYWLSFHEMPIILLWNLWCDSCLFCATVSRHKSAPYNIVDITNDSYNLTSSVVLICLFFHTDFNLRNTLLALPTLVWQSLSQLYRYLSHSYPTKFLSHLDCSISYEYVMYTVVRSGIQECDECIQRQTML